MLVYIHLFGIEISSIQTEIDNTQIALSTNLNIFNMKAQE
jgi:hypothetical protein